jgi:hypothetical protein
MREINYTRVLFGGVIAGVVFVIADMLFPIVFSGAATAWLERMGFAAPAGGALIGALLVTLDFGLIAVWLYAAIRPRFGAGPTTAIYAGLAVWALAILLPSLSFATLGLEITAGFWFYTIWWLVFAPLGTVAGAYFYREEAATAVAPQTVAADF